MKRIGILTYFTDIPYFNDINPGMNLQAYGVYQMLKDQYPNDQIEFIRYHSWWAFWRIYISNITLASFIKDCKQFYKYKKFAQYFPRSQKALICLDYEKSSKFINNLNYDVIYVGSDTLLELIRAPKNEITAYWLSPIIKAKKFMIAASARDTSYDKLTQQQRARMKLSINSFLAMGVRDQATYELINNFLKENDERLEMVPDPTFYYNINYRDADLYAQENGLAGCKKPIVCFHLLKTNQWADKLAEIYHKQGYLIASLRPYKYADFLLKDLSPTEFAGIFKYFKITITHRFHDTVFCIKNISPVLIYLPSASYKNLEGNSKQSSIMESFDLKGTNYIDNINMLTAEEIKEKADIAYIAFNKKKDNIKELLLLYKKQLKEYINKTAEIL
ncbi:MAG: polysaccharide pyruvyl transferase family protein [Bacteroides sp.]|jgi:hypothetical protein|nr:polysaccharide pyruvyl transferase family protein [Bacteroides sp.]MCI1683209.1 polysaccharide pyruvyl transferase family protein [Bacteroides sp.]